MPLTTSDISATIATSAVADRRDFTVSGSSVASAVSAVAGSSGTPVTATPPATSLPVTAVQAPATPGSLEAAVKALNDRYSSQRTDLKFSVDKSSGQTVVAIVDAKDGTVLRQIPSEEALRIARTLDKNPGGLIENVA